jgi:hypothetical protein
MFLVCLQMIPNQDTVKLFNLGEPRKVTLPQDASTLKAGRWVYLAPEVLRGEEYTTQGDLYSLALLAFELSNQELAFKEKRRQMTLNQFVEEGGSDFGDDTSPFSGIVAKSVGGRQGERVWSTVWVNETRKLMASHQGHHAEEEEL